jgi:hypothetical protein
MLHATNGIPAAVIEKILNTAGEVPEQLAGYLRMNVKSIQIYKS